MPHVASESFHERFEDLTGETRDLHRAIVSLMEELEAVDWYQQRVDAATDDDLRAVLAHNRDEEIEHAMMNLEWIRRRVPTFDAAARVYLFSQGPITEVEAAATASGEAPSAPAGGARPGGGSSSGAQAAPADGSLGIGSLKLT